MERKYSQVGYSVPATMLITQEYGTFCPASALQDMTARHYLRFDSTSPVEAPRMLGQNRMDVLRASPE